MDGALAHQPSFARYQVLGRIGSGGMGDVWLARALGPAGFEKLVVLKTIRMGATSAATSMFLREARIAALLSHPNCVQVFELGEQDGSYYIVMELIDGMSLARVIHRSEGRGVQIPVPVVARIAMDAAAGLEYAHTLCDPNGTPISLVHRDVTLENVLITFRGQTKLVDFGIAKAASAATNHDSETSTGILKGKLGYMAPEYLQGAPIGPQSDVFSLGVVLYRALTGKKPFEGESAYQVLAHALQMPPRSIRDVRSDVPADFETAVLKALAKTPSERFETARAVRHAIAAAVPDAADTDGVASFMTSLWPDNDDERTAVRRMIVGQPSGATPAPLAPASAAEPTAPTVPLTWRKTSDTEPRRAESATDPEPHAATVLKRSDLPAAAARPTQRRRRRLVIATVGVAVVAITAGVLALTQRSKGDAGAVRGPIAAGRPVQVLIADFHNLTGEPMFDGALETMFGMALEEAPSIATFPRGYARRSLRETTKTRLDDATARQIAVRETIDAVVNGTITSSGPGFALAITAIDASSGRIIAHAERRAGSKHEALIAVAELAAPIRRAFGDTTSSEAQRTAIERFTTKSLEAAHSYAQARELLDMLDNHAAIPILQHVIELDPEFAVAYTGLAAAYLNTVQVDEARHAFDLAFARIDKMSDRQRFMTRGMYYATQGEPKKAVDLYKKMLERFPDDRVALRHLAQTYSILNQFAQALEVTRRILERNPKDMAARSNLAGYMLLSGDFHGAIEQATQLLEVEPGSAELHRVLAMAHAFQGELTEAIAVIRQTERMPGGASNGALHLAAFSAMQGRTRDALALLEPAITADREHDVRYEAAYKEWLRGYEHRMRGETKEARAAYDRAIAMTSDPDLAFITGHEYIEIGATDKAKTIARDLANRIDVHNRTSAQILDGALALHAGRPTDAIRSLDAAQQSIDTWIGTFDAGLAYLAAGAFPEAHDALSSCMQRRAEAGILFVMVPTIWYYLGRAQEGLKSPAAADSYRAYLAARGSADADPYLADVRRRLDALPH